MIDYEIDGFVETAKKSDIYCHRVEDLHWSEIDDYEHYVNAKENIYPKILLAKSKKQFIKWIGTKYGKVKEKTYWDS